MGKRGPRLSPVPEIPVAPAPERPVVPPDWLILTEEGAALILKCSPQTVRRRAERGDVPRRRVGGEWRYYVYDLLDYALSAGPDGDPTGT